MYMPFTTENLSNREVAPDQIKNITGNYGSQRGNPTYRAGPGSLLVVAEW